jgi:hypothetical protein
MSNESGSGSGLFVPHDEHESSQGRWLSTLGRIQDVLLYVWVAHVCFVVQTFSSLVNFIALGALWVLMLLVGTWHLVKVPTQRHLAAWTMAAFPLAFVLIKVVDATVGVPIVGEPGGRPLFYGAVSVLPLYWLARWLLRTTTPQSQNPVRMRATAAVLLIIVFTQMWVSLFLVWVLSSGKDFQFFKNVLGHDWYSNLLQSSLALTLLTAIGGVPYAILGLVRGSGHRGAMLGILFCIAVSAICAFGVFGFIALMSFG